MEDSITLMPSSGDITIPNNEPETFSFVLGKKTLLELGINGIKFNREEFPDYGPEDFATQFMDILEETFAIQFVPVNKVKE